MTQASPNLPVVGIGASAGGLEALSTFFQGLPADLGAAFVVIVHLAPDQDSSLAEILGRDTAMPVLQVGDHERRELRADHVYVIAPDRKLELKDRSVGAAPFEEPHGQRFAVDLFFRSLARARGNVVAVVLSGGGADGAVGAKAVKEMGGLVLVQDPQEAEHKSMPAAAIATGVTDLVLPARELAIRLGELLRSDAKFSKLLEVGETAAAEEDGQGDEEKLGRLFHLLRRRTGHDFSNYKRSTVLRRLVRRMQLLRADSLHDYLACLEDDVEELQALFNDLLITVTSFFRNPESWAALQEVVIKPLVFRGPPEETIRCWTPACATGEEAYTLAMLFGEEIERQGVEREVVIFASDVDERALHTAREGVYPAPINADVSDERLHRSFQRTDDHYRVAHELRDRVVFANHSLQRDPPFSRLHLVCCRNLLIYLDRELQERVMQILRYSLREDGHLFLGSSETASEELFRPLSKQHRIYEVRPGDGRRPSLPQLPEGIPALPPRREQGRTPPQAEAAADAHRDALEQQSPPSVLVDERWGLLHLSETAGRYLSPGGGPYSQLVTDQVRAELRGELVLALRHVFEQKDGWLSDFVAVRFNGHARRVAVLVQPRPTDEGEVLQALVTFLEAGDVADPRPDEEVPAGHSDRERTLLEKLHQAEQSIEKLREDYHLGREDLHATREELQSLDEEYRSTTEELETSKEELQSINEELQTLNGELKGKLEEISRAHSDLENVMAATDIGTLFVDRKLCIKRFTPKLTEIFNLKAYDQGRPIGDITHNLEYQKLDRDARRVLTELSPLERDTRSRDGRHFVVRLRPYRTSDDRIDGVVVTLLDVTSVKRAEERLRRSEERFRALVDASAQMVWTADKQGAVAEDSPSWRHFTGQSREARRGSGWLEAVHPDDRAAVEAAWRHGVEARLPFTEEFRIHSAEHGGFRWTSLRAVPLSTSGGAGGWVAMNTDVDNRRRAEQRLVAADRRKDEFLATLGHELRNPLGAIRTSVELVHAAELLPDDGEFRRAFDIVDRQSQHMARLVDDLLDITRITRDKLELRRRPTDIRVELDNVLNDHHAWMEQARLEVHRRLPDEAVLVEADPDRLVQMFDNLLHNAVANTGPGGSIEVSVERGTGHAIIRFRDSGTGMDPTEIDHLFEPFQQSRRGPNAGSGLGLGLAVVKRLAELHGGSVSASSDGEGKGSEFCLELPLAAGTASASERSAAVPGAAPARRRVLVVDDDVDNARALGMLLKRLGQEVEIAHTGDGAVRAALAKRPQIALLDLSMPDIHGRELARKLRQHFTARELLLVAVSGHPEDRALGEDSDFQRHLLKPLSRVSLDELLAMAPDDGA